MSWPRFRIISGATYSGVPQKVQVRRPLPIFLEKPKSTLEHKTDIMEMSGRGVRGMVGECGSGWVYEVMGGLMRRWVG